MLRASRSMRVTVTTSHGASLPSIRFKLALKGLPVSGDAGIADEPFFGVSFDHSLR